MPNRDSHGESFDTGSLIPHNKLQVTSNTATILYDDTLRLKTTIEWALITDAHDRYNYTYGYTKGQKKIRETTTMESVGK